VLLIEDRTAHMGFVNVGCAEGGCGFPINDIGTSFHSGRGNGGDDAADCMRYLVATKSRVVAQRKLRGCNGACAISQFSKVGWLRDSSATQAGAVRQ
jgi:hypothetical protein